MRLANFGAVSRVLPLASVLTLLTVPLSAQIVERSRTWADLIASHPCNSGLDGRKAIVTDAQSSSSIGGGGGSVQVFVQCDGVDTWSVVSIGGVGGAATAVTGSATLPATCTEKDLYQDTDSGGTELYVCTATDIWTKAGVGSIGGSTGAVDNLLLRSDGTGAATVQNSPLSLSDVSGVTTTLATITPAAANGATVAGQSLAITASPAVASLDTAGAAAGGSVTITAGAAARNTSGNANGGDINLVTGAGIGTGTAGQVLFPNGVLAKPSAGWAGGISGIYYDSGLHIMHNGAERITLAGSGVQFNSLVQGQGNIFGGYKTGIVLSTAGVGSPRLANEADSFYTLTNEGTTAVNYHTLPTATAGYLLTFCDQDADGIRITANTADTIRVIDKVTAAAGYIQSTTIGSCVTLTAINAVEWFATSITGTWTDGTFTYDDTGLTTP